MFDATYMYSMFHIDVYNIPIQKILCGICRMMIENIANWYLERDLGLRIKILKNENIEIPYSA